MTVPPKLGGLQGGGPASVDVVDQWQVRLDLLMELHRRLVPGSVVIDARHSLKGCDP